MVITSYTSRVLFEPTIPRSVVRLAVVLCAGFGCCKRSSQDKVRVIESLPNNWVENGLHVGSYFHQRY